MPVHSSLLLTLACGPANTTTAKLRAPVCPCASSSSPTCPRPIRRLATPSSRCLLRGHRQRSQGWFQVTVCTSCEAVLVGRLEQADWTNLHLARHGTGRYTEPRFPPKLCR